MYFYFMSYLKIITQLAIFFIVVSCLLDMHGGFPPRFIPLQRSKAPSRLWGEIRKCSFIFFDQAHRPHSENPSRERSSSNRRNLKNPAFLFLVDGKHFENGVSDNDVITIISWFPCPSLAQTRIQNTGDCCFLNSSGLLFTESILCVFVVKPPFSNSSDAVWA